MSGATPFLLWCGNVQALGLGDRLEAARAGGFESMSVSPLDVLRWRDSGVDDGALLRACSEAGVRIAAVDPLTKWTPTWDAPAEMDDDGIAFGNVETHVVLDMARSLGASMVTAVEYTGHPLDTAIAAASFGELCDSALAFGIRVGLEPMPFSGIPTLSQALEIVQTANRPNGGLVLDAWHQFRSPDAKNDLVLVSTLPGELVFALQLNDAPTRPHAPIGLREETMHHRRLPGQGDIDLHTYVSAISSTGALPLTGPEVFSDELMEKLSPPELGRELRRATERYI